MKRSFLLLSILFFNLTTYQLLLAQDWTKYFFDPMGKHMPVAVWSNSIVDPGMVGINRDPASPIMPGWLTLPPALLVHSNYNLTHAAEVTGYIRLQSAQSPVMNPKGETYLQFWSNDWNNPFQWQLGEIRGINLGTNTTSPAGLFKGGLGFYCSGGPDIGTAQTNPREVLRLINGKAGIGFTNSLEPEGLLDVIVDPGWKETRISMNLKDHQPSIRLFKNTGGYTPACGTGKEWTQVYQWWMQLTDVEGQWGNLTFYNSDPTCFPNDAGIVPRVTFSSNGNVGIGETGPSQKLVVNGNTIIKGYMNSQTGLIGTSSTWNPNHILDVRGTIATGGYNEIDRTNKDGTISFYPSQNDSWYHLDNREGWGFTLSTGNTPGLLLPVGQNQPPKGIGDILNVISWGKLVGIGCNVSANPPNLYQFDAGNGLEDFHFKPAGPTGMLTVSDQLWPWYDGSAWHKFGGNGVVLRLERRDAPIDEKEYKLISAGHNNSETFMVWANGKVNIGDKVPVAGLPNGYKLSVDGSIVTKEVIVTVQNWSDFVFKPDYKLQDLNEVEQFINSNGHLPGIPSENEVKANGVSLNDMQAKLLQKVEELTLYVIELKKENQELKQQIKEIKK